MIRIAGFPQILDLPLSSYAVWGILILIAFTIFLSSLILFYHWGRFGHNAKAVVIGMLYTAGVVIILGGALYFALSSSIL
jgi:hypothetical protein